MGMNDINSLSHSKWNYKYHIVFAPKYRLKVFYKAKRAANGKILRRVAGNNPLATGRSYLRVDTLREEQRATPAYEEPPVLPGGSFLYKKPSPG